MRTLPLLLAAAAAITVGALTWSASAQQAPFGYRSPNAITAENLVGVGYDRLKIEGEDPEAMVVTGLLSPAQDSTLSLPARIGYHRFVSDGLSLGLLANYLENGVSTTTWMVGPRLGYSFAMGDDLAFWLRAGINYSTLEVGYGLGTMEAWNLLGAGDLLFVYTPVPHVGLIFGAIAEVGLAGKASVKSSSPLMANGAEQDIRQTFIAGTMGLLLDF